MSRSKSVFWAIAMALTAALLIVNAALSYRNTAKLVESELASRASRESLAALDDLFASVEQARSRQRVYLLSGSAADLRSYQDALSKLTQELPALGNSLGADSHSSQPMSALAAAIAQELAQLQHTSALAQGGDRAGALAGVTADGGMRQMADVRALVDELRAAQVKLQQARDLAAEEALKTANRQRWIGMLIGLSLVALTIILLRRDLTERRRIAANLFAQKEWLSATLNGIGDAVIVTDASGRVVLLNPVAEQMTGWSSVEATGKPLLDVFDIVDESTRERADNPVERALASGSIVGLTHHTILRSRAGREYVIEDSAAPTFDAGGKVRGAVMVFHDSTPRRDSELALAASHRELARRAELALGNERILDTILHNAPIGIALTDANDGYPVLAISRQMREWIDAGVPPQATPGSYRMTPANGGAMSPEQLPLQRAMRDGNDVRGEHWTIERNDRPPLTVAVDVAPIRDDAGKIVGAINIWIDETERRRLDRALRVTESRLLVLVRANVIGLILNFHRNGTVIDANAAFVEMLGYTLLDVAAGSINLAAITPLRYHAMDAQAFRELDESDSCTPYEKEFERKDGTRVAVVVGYARVADGGDAYVGFVLDISPRKRLEEQLRQQAEQLIEADRRKDEFLAMLSHELRNPVAPLRNAVYLLESQGNDQAALQNLMPIMRRQIEQLVRLIDDLLDAARITQGKIALDKRRIPLRPILDAAVEIIQPLFQARRHNVKLDFGQSSFDIDGDGARLTQMVSNILHNAAKYTPPCGTVEVSLRQEDRQAVIRVIDSGQGIDADLLPRVFDIFTQADRSLARSSGGIGVGLALVRRVAELHGGSVGAFSAGADRGSEFVIRLPLAARDVPEAQDAGPIVAATDARSQRILLVDDNVDLASSTAALLELWGHDTQVAYTGQDAIVAAQAFKPEIILMDIGLPEMDGFEVLRRLREAGQLKGVRTIAMTGYGQDQDKRRVQEAGFHAHLIKPVHPTAIKELLDAL